MNVISNLVFRLSNGRDINVQNPNKSDSVPEYVGEIDEFQSAPNNIATIVNESKVTYTTQVTDQPSAIDLQEVGKNSVDRSESNIMSLLLDRQKAKLLITEY